MSSFPTLISPASLRIVIDHHFNWVVIHWGPAFTDAMLPILRFLDGFAAFLVWLPWYVVIAGLVLLSYVATRGRSVPIAVGAMLVLIGLGGLWHAAMSTIALMLTGTVIAVALGLPIGILMSRVDRAEQIALPVLDIMQTMPIFVYLIPFVMLFGPGKIPALLATVVFAIPPVIRLTNLGIRHVDHEVIEAVTAFGTTKRQRLLTVQLPLAMPSIMAGINQTTMMALSMVVVASMIGAGGLGYQVLEGIQRLQLGRGLLAGVAIVFLAIIFDRIAQSYGNRMQEHLHVK